MSEGDIQLARCPVCKSENLTAGNLGFGKEEVMVSAPSAIDQRVKAIVCLSCGHIWLNLWYGPPGQPS